ncbi:MAG: hypothetical protein LBS21_16250 [Clostridiales bacterium]|nr:hypothetical protein [Clostridiales bacterium]
MADCFVSLIPVDPEYVLDFGMMNELKGVMVDGAKRVFEISDVVLFADAGQNLENITCPYCKSNLDEWWGNAMDSAYSEDKGFINLSIRTPCCNKTSSLNNLNYYFPQGFYRTRIKYESELLHNIDFEGICEKISEISGIQWRVIHTRI